MLLSAGCGAERDAAGDGMESGEGAESGLEAEAPEANPPSGDTDDPSRMTPPAGPGGDPDAVADGLADPGVTADGADPVAGDSTAGGPDEVALEELTTRRVPAGTRIRVTVDHELSTDLYRPGDAVVATVADSVTDPSGEVLIPRGVKLLGRILASEGSPAVDEPPVLEMAFETLSALNGEWPVEGAVINVPVVVDSRAGIARRLQRNRLSDREVPGVIGEGAVVVVEFRAGFRVGAVVGPEAFPEDSLPVRDTLPGAGLPG